MESAVMTASGRKALGMALLLTGLALYALIAAAILGDAGRLPLLVEVLIYAIAGTAWIFPAKLLFNWMETGRWRLTKDAQG
jgi:hypothetical protein